MSKCLAVPPNLEKATLPATSSSHDQFGNLARKGFFDPQSNAALSRSAVRPRRASFLKNSRLCLRDPTGFNAMKNKEGNVTTSPKQIAEILKDHWGGVCKTKQVDTTALQIWMEDLFIQDENGLFITGLPAHGSDRWRIKEKSVRLARNTMPGPDGIPAAAYKQLPIVVDIFVAVAKTKGPPKWWKPTRIAVPLIAMILMHRCYAACRKKPLARTRNIVIFVTGDSFRPLAFVNTDKRVIASAARITWEPVLSHFTSSYQQGFLKGRQMLSNVFDIDYASMIASLKSERGSTADIGF